MIQEKEKTAVRTNRGLFFANVVGGGIIKPWNQNQGQTKNFLLH